MSLINKYQISEKDLYQLGLIESRKKTSGLFKKEKLKAASLKILKPYNIKFLDLGNLLNEIKIGDFVNLSDNETVKIESIIELSRTDTQTYIISVEDNHNFYANKILVHNK